MLISPREFIYLFVKEDQNINNYVKKLLESIDALDFATDQYGLVREDRIDQFIVRYENDLGLAKWVLIIL